jgi:hypothetical protein
MQPLLETDFAAFVSDFTGKFPYWRVDTNNTVHPSWGNGSRSVVISLTADQVKNGANWKIKTGRISGGYLDPNGSNEASSAKSPAKSPAKPLLNTLHTMCVTQVLYLYLFYVTFLYLFWYRALKI